MNLVDGVLLLIELGVMFTVTVILAWGMLAYLLGGSGGYFHTKWRA